MAAVNVEGPRLHFWSCIVRRGTKSHNLSCSAQEGCITNEAGQKKVATTATAGTAGTYQATTSATTRAASAAPTGAIARAGALETATGATTAGERGVAPTGLIYGGGGNAST